MIIEICPYDCAQFDVGLCNKLRTIISFCGYCEKNGFKLKVRWDYFYNLFPNILDNSLFTDKPSDIVYGPPLFYPLGECNNCAGGCKCDIDVDYYSSSFTFKKYFDMLIPNNDIQNKIKEFENNFEIHNCFGVHIRENDWINFSNRNGYNIPNDELYIRHITDKLKTNKYFYFTTDNLSKYSTYSNIFGLSCKYWLNKNLDRASDGSFTDAYIDLVLLSKTKFLIGNKMSSYSYHASRINNIEFIKL